MHSRNTGMVCCDIPVVLCKARLALMQAMQAPAGRVQTPRRTNGPDTLIRQAIPHLPKQDDAIWSQVAKTAKSKYGITVKFKRFTDYSQPNKEPQFDQADTTICVRGKSKK